MVYIGLFFNNAPPRTFKKNREFLRRMYRESLQQRQKIVRPPDWNYHKKYYMNTKYEVVVCASFVLSTARAKSGTR